MCSFVENSTNIACTAELRNGSGNIVDAFLQQKWNNFLDVVGDDREKLYVWGMLTFVYSQYWLIGGLYVGLNVTGWPKFLRKYKMQPGVNDPILWKDLKRIMKTMLMNQLLLTVPMAYFGFHLGGKHTLPDVRVLPPLATIIRDIVISLALWEVVAYYMHRILHHRSLYRFIHKRHHEFVAPVAWAASHVHPVEHILSDTIPASVGPMLLNCHLFTLLVLFSYLVQRALIQHSGYHLPFLSSPESHDYHHLNFSQCFGPTGLMDRIFGTDDRFRKTKFAKRDRVLFGTKSARELVPDKD
uniref:Putative c-4 sterol methyl oxidase n=1 Tax=Culex tarsalis TaxID=7177 RepID=A0A1Q3EVG2_CULTA